jgi:hypothetical protein
VSATEWDIDLVMSGYQQAHEHVVTSGRDVWIEVRLRR